MSGNDQETFEERQLQIAKKIKQDEVNSFFDGVLQLLISVPLLLPLYQTWQWLQFGKWVPFTAAQVLEDTLDWTPVVSWIGVQSLIDNTLQTPLLVWLYLAAALILATLYAIRKIISCI